MRKPISIRALVLTGMLVQAVVLSFHRLASPAADALADALLWFPYGYVPVLAFIAAVRGSNLAQGALFGIVFALNGLGVASLAVPAFFGAATVSLQPLGEWRPWWMNASDWLCIASLFALLGVAGVMTGRFSLGLYRRLLGRLRRGDN